ncbi:MAG: tRNA (adenosine(37)-N6)-dimethylallyltransferase MiaA [Bacteroidetes bacterium]|nr:tRNA (adenosine(37)-N6)-dimethylallyltransferase MiaA [Bacteroidota bacterium]
MIVILGPTASGKTALASRIAYEFNGEVISADSRQVYRGMSIGTGKDLSEYCINGKNIPYHLIDIVEPGYEYNIFEFQKDFLKAYNSILSRGKLPVLCGGSGMYLESVLKKYEMKEAEGLNEPGDEFSNKTDDELNALLLSLRTPHNTTDLIDRQRMIRAIRIGLARDKEETKNLFPEEIKPMVFGIGWDREVLRKRITARLKQRIEHGMIEEVKDLLDHGLTPEQLKFYGLEYRYITLYLQKKLDFNEMFRLLNIAIHQFAKRQMTWFRKMEKAGLIIHWISGETDLNEKISKVKAQF